MTNDQQNAVMSDPPRPLPGNASVSDYMVRKLITFTPDMDIIKVIETLMANKIAGAPVLNERKELVGVIDDKDCLRVLFDSAYHNQPVNNRTVACYMSTVMKTISIHISILEVADLFLNTFYKRFLVVDDEGRLVGQISRHDILRAINDLHAFTR